MLLPKKNESTYTEAFSELAELAEEKGVELDPGIILVDFELAAINAARASFPGAEMHGCFFFFFHFN